MQFIVGSITIKMKDAKGLDKIEFDHLFSKTEDNNINVFFFGQTNFININEVLEYFETILGKNILNHDISIDINNKIHIIKNESIYGKYYCLHIHGSNIESVMQELPTNIKNSSNLIIIRESQESKSHGGKIINVDIIKKM